MSATHPLFFELVFSMEAAAVSLLQKEEKKGEEWEAFKRIVDLLEMLEEKTASNLSYDEKKILSEILVRLRMAYVERASAPKTS